MVKGKFGQTSKSLKIWLEVEKILRKKAIQDEAVASTDDEPHSVKIKSWRA